MSDVDITIGADTSAAQAGLASLRNAATQVGSELRSTFAQTLAVGGIVSAISSVIEKMHEIHQEATRFGVDVEALQQIAIPAKEVGISLESVARAMNLVELAGVKAAEGNKQMVAALSELNINVLNFNNLKADQKIVAVAEAFEKSAKSADDYAAVAQLLGRRFGTELIPAFDGIIRRAHDGTSALDTFSRTQIEAGEQAHLLAEKLKQVAFVEIGGPLVVGILRVRAALIDTYAAAQALAESLVKLSKLDFSGTTAAGNRFLDVLKLQGPGFQDLQNTLNKANQPAKTTGAGGGAGGDLSELGGFTGSGTGGGGGGGGGGSSSLDFEAREEKNRLAALDDASRLNDLLVQRTELQAKLDEGNETRNLSNEEEIALSTQIFDLTDQIVPLQKSIADDNERSAIAAAKWAEDARDAAAAEQEASDELQLTLDGHADVAAQLKLEFDYQTRINQAYRDGNTELAQTLTDQKAIAAEALANQQAFDAATRAGKIAGIPGIPGVDRQTGATLPGHFFSPQQAATINVRGGVGQEMDTAFGLALLASGGRTDTAIFTQTLNQYRALEQIGNITGKSVFNLQQSSSAQAAIGRYAATIGNTAIAQNTTQQQAQLAYYQAIYAGQTPAVNPFTPPTLPSTAAGTSVQISQLSTQIQIMQAQLTQLQTINKNLTPTVGSI